MIDEKIDWHDILQTILDNHLAMMSGKQILETEREVSKHMRIDYYCRTAPGRPEDPAENVEGIRPFDHLLEYNVFEYKSIHETLNERMFREYAARAIIFETRHGEQSLQDKLTLNIILTRVPRNLLQNPNYSFTAVTPWKYRCDFQGLPVYLLIQRKMRNINGGEPLAYLQVLEGDPRYRKEVWGNLIEQNLTGEKDLEGIMIRISREAYMSIAERIIERARPIIAKQAIEGARSTIAKEAIEGARPTIAKEAVEGARPRIIEEARPRLLFEGKMQTLTRLLDKKDLWHKYGDALQSARTLAELDEIEAKIMEDL
ncbi:MAG: hypothetical protein QNK37_06125 [Acidobacteriota bacterium]|nr:hypothetical protein [Acidobacteriota bacterium]